MKDRNKPSVASSGGDCHIRSDADVFLKQREIAKTVDQLRLVCKSYRHISKITFVFNSAASEDGTTITKKNSQNLKTSSRTVDMKNKALLKSPTDPVDDKQL